MAGLYVLIFAAILISAILGPVLYRWYQCPQCGSPTMRETGVRNTSGKYPIIQMRCRNCGHTEYRDEPPAG